jgi:hypothetical protein
VLELDDDGKIACCTEYYDRAIIPGGVSVGGKRKMFLCCAVKPVAARFTQIRTRSLVFV